MIFRIELWKLDTFSICSFIIVVLHRYLNRPQKDRVSVLFIIEEKQNFNHLK